MDSLEVLGRHYIFVLNLKLVTGLDVGDTVAAAAYLGACSAVGTRIHFVQAQIAFARHRHAQSSVTEHLKAYLLTPWPAYVLFLDGTVYG